jgi:AAA domain
VIVERVGLDDLGDVAAAMPAEISPNGDGPTAPEPFAGLSHAEVLDLTFGDAPPELVEGLVPRGVLVIVAGLPETYKGWVCAKLAAIVAAGEGELFDRPACAQGPVGYFWQDDSTRNEAERVQLFSKVHETPRDLPLRWFLNEGAILPDDLGRLRATIEHYRLVLVVLDSVYNFTPGLDLKDRDIGQLFARLKAEVCDPTGCTVVVVDHMPWATEQNRKRMRSYGDVFKGAAARAGIYIDADGSKLHVEARGNNVRGFKRTPAYWDADALELRLVDAEPDQSDDDLDEAVLAWLTENVDQHSTRTVRKAVSGRNERIDESLERLKARGALRDCARNGGAWSGEKGTPRYWIASVHAEGSAPQLFGAHSGALEAEAPWELSAPPAPPPRRGGALERGALSEDVSEDENERPAAASAEAQT